MIEKILPIEKNDESSEMHRVKGINDSFLAVMLRGFDS